MKQSSKIRVLVAKPGLDGHDRGAKIVALALRDAGMEVIYSGLHRSVEEIVKTALEESVDVVGLSILSGAHLPITKKVVEGLKQAGLTDVLVVVGGVIPKGDIDILKSYGAHGVFPFSSELSDIIKFIQQNAAKKKRSSHKQGKA